MTVLRPHAAVTFEYVNVFPANCALTVTETYVETFNCVNTSYQQKNARILRKVLTVLSKNSEKLAVHEYTNHHVY